MMKNLEKFNLNAGDKVLFDGDVYLILDRNITPYNIGMYQLQNSENENHKFWQAAHITEQTSTKL
ncbi:hypothetical protein vipetofem_87 [Enterococcus phage vipetofem]|uniref:Uncharacterized protein n=1 Tax=Enterococcus phage vipetofem TaxID=2719594 RepID=A0A6G9LL79_9CAUD|nr:hypothetical protein KNU92_gp053 [Enterococcus phage vipetofem]QIQ66385.1 hypothetical protein vipetofem_87 [Enterococcus phage vipetofem]